MTGPVPADRAARFAADLIVDVINDGCAQQWRRRAEVFRAARPTAADFLGRRTVEEQRERWHELTAVAEACEARASFLETRPQDRSEVHDVMQDLVAPEVAA